MKLPATSLHTAPSTVPFFAATLVWTWIWWFPIARLPRGTELSEFPWWMFGCLLVGSYGPSIMGLVFTRKEQGREGVRLLLRGLVAWRAGWLWMALAVMAPWIVLAAGLTVGAVLGISFGESDWSRLVLLPVALIAALPFGPLAEELGWRGYATPRLTEQIGAIGASVVVGLFWTLWHLPLFWAPAGTTISGGPINLLTVGAYAATLVTMSFIATWLLWRGANVVLLGLLLHVGFNVDAPLIPFPDMPEGDERVAVQLAALVGLGVVLVLARLLRGVRNLDSRAGK